MELGEQIRATLQKDGIGMARKTFGEENVANELKKENILTFLQNENI